MEYEIITKDSFSVCGLSVDLTTSQNENAKIISRLWKSFNRELHTKYIKSGPDWVKYGITQKTNDAHTYMTAVPTNHPVPGFEELVIAPAKYARFQHTGSRANMKATFLNIYKEAIPKTDLMIDPKRSIVHFEQYDHRFHWTRSNSVIDIYVPMLG